MTPNSRSDWIIVCFDLRIKTFPEVEMPRTGLGIILWSAVSQWLIKLACVLQQLICLCRYSTCISLIIAELQRAKRASEAPWVRKIGNPSSRETHQAENDVSVRPSERASERTSVQTRGEGEGRLEIFLTVNNMGNSLFPWRFFV